MSHADNLGQPIRTSEYYVVLRTSIQITHGIKKALASRHNLASFLFIDGHIFCLPRWTPVTGIVGLLPRPLLEGGVAVTSRRRRRPRRYVSGLNLVLCLKIYFLFSARDFMIGFR